MASLFEHSVLPLPSLSPISDHPTPHSDIAATVQPTVATLPQEEHTGMSLVKVMLLLDQKYWWGNFCGIDSGILTHKVLNTLNTSMHTYKRTEQNGEPPSNPFLVMAS